MKVLLTSVCCTLGLLAGAQTIITEHTTASVFPVVASGLAASILYDNTDDSLIGITAGLLRDDIERVSNVTAMLATHLPAAKNIVVIGTAGRSRWMQQLISNKKLNVSGIAGRWEAYQVQVVKHPFKGVEQALVITGSDKRGVAYGALELSRQMGVSPWYWWADVPVRKRGQLYAKANMVVIDSPHVRYRGIFINDEAPCLSSWAKETFGGFNHRFYEKVFELILRLRGNYLWPAMWGNAFNDDDKLNPVLADKWGIVMGTSHHEPMMRAQQEWKRFGLGGWNYVTNKKGLQEFWKKGIANMGKHEYIATIGMRGDGDEPMTQGTATALLESIVSDQRGIIQEVTGKPAACTPQLWALYKEVQDYYDQGMRVPDDVTLLLCDDNWGNLRKLPGLNEKARAGGYGIYYHFDYVGGPRNYKWLNTNNLARVWEQMHLAYRYGADKIWIVNVGDIKPMELPVSFFLDYAWEPNTWNEDNIQTYYTNWAAAQFGSRWSSDIGHILQLYAQYSSRRKPELLDAKTYEPEYYNEAGNVLSQWNQLEAQASKINEELPPGYRDAYFQLVLHPVKALANLHVMYYSIAINHKLAAAKKAEANDYAEKAKFFYRNDSVITEQYHQVAGGKWRHMMQQVHIGYKGWNNPPVNQMPAVFIVPAQEAALQTADVKAVTEQEKVAIVPSIPKGNVFYEKEGVVSIEAENWTRCVNTKEIQWKVIPGIGRTGSGISTFPVTISSKLSPASPHVDYDFYTYDSGRAQIRLYCSPTLSFCAEGALQMAVAVDGEAPVVIKLNEDSNSRSWGGWVADNVIKKNMEAKLMHAGKHTISYWMMSPAVVLQKIVVDLGGEKPSYLGPPETRIKSQ